MRSAIADLVDAVPDRLDISMRCASVVDPAHANASSDMHMLLADALVRDAGWHATLEARQESRLRAVQKLHLALCGAPTRAQRVHILNTLGVLHFEGQANVTLAMQYWIAALRVNRSAYEPQGNLVLALLQQGRIEEARAINARALAQHPSDFRLRHNMGVILHQLDQPEQALQYWQEALQLAPQNAAVLVSIAMAQSVRGDADAARRYLDRAASAGIADRVVLGVVRLQRVLAQLEMIYASKEALVVSRRAVENGLAALLVEDPPLRLDDPIASVGGSAMGYYALYQGYFDLRIRAQLASVYQRANPRLLQFTAPHVVRDRHKRFMFVKAAEDRPRQDDDKDDKDDSAAIVTLRRRVRVGFLSAFFRHHSVGLLLERVILGLAQSAQLEIVILTFQGVERDALGDRIRAAAARVVELPSRDLHAAQRAIAALELDVLVFSEIGMDVATYFLAFARLALRSVVFWGHAVTTGIDSVDYFVSSKRFAVPATRFSECLVQMESLTTAFAKPSLSLSLSASAPPLTRDALGLPAETVLPHLLLIPQTLYKLHPDMDRLIDRILSTLASTAFLVLPLGAKPLLVQQLLHRWRRTLSRSVYQRVFFVRRLDPSEFLQLCAMATLVLDPFPVGGGRSSLEVFSVGTPILGLWSKTTVLQLTWGMYDAMGIAPTCCMFAEQDELVDQVVLLLTHPDALHQLKAAILARHHVLYEEKTAMGVVAEWQRFILAILAHKPPRLIATQELARGGDQTRDKHCPVVDVPPPPPLLVYETTVRRDAAAHDAALHTLRLFDGQDAFHIAQSFGQALSPPLDHLQIALLGKRLWNMQHRRMQPIVHHLQLDLDSAAASTKQVEQQRVDLEIRRGDDLHQVIPWQLNQHWRAHGQHPSHIERERSITRAIELAHTAIPQHQQDDWIAARSLPRRSAEIKPHDGQDHQDRSDCLALVVTSCRRLSLFLQTMQSLVNALGISDVSDAKMWSRWFCQVLVIDDNSSKDDRQAMQTAFPTFEYLFKPSTQRGHARSLNLALQRVHARFLFYLEDDWQCRSNSPDQQQPDQFLMQALAILRATSLTQVLLNDHHSGWPRNLMTNPTIRYFRHEFAAAEPSHAFSYWPGFSLNPGVWDLGKMAALGLIQADSVGHATFDETSDIFEQQFALDAWRAGLHIGFLSREWCVHIGTNLSAYVLNGLPRRFDG